MPRPTLPPAPVYSAAVDSPVINFMEDYFRPRTHQVLFLLCIFLVYFNYYEHNYFALRYFCMQENYPLQSGVMPRRHVRRYRAASRTGVSWSELHQRAGRLARPHRLTTPRTTCPSALAAGSRVRAGLQRGGQLARPHRLTNTVAGLSVYSRGRFTREGFRFHPVIINFRADYFRPKHISDIILRRWRHASIF